MDGGLNTYGYVGGNPLLKVDPRGLIEWNGTVLAGSVLIGAFDIYTLKTKCINGKQGFARVHALGFGVGFGIPATYNGGTITFEDNLNDVNPQVFNGQYLKFSYGVSGGIGMGGMIVKLGGATSSLGGLKPALIAGFDLAIDGVGGSAKVVKSEIKDCGCEDVL